MPGGRLLHFGRGTVDWKVERGVVNVNGKIEITGIKDTQKTVCTGVEMFRKLLDREVVIMLAFY